MKYVLVLLVVGIALWLLVGRSQGRGSDRVKAAPPPDTFENPGAAPLSMVSCAHCGLHLPQAEALEADGQSYCSEAHRHAGPAS